MPPYAICMAPDAIADAQVTQDEESRVDEWGDDFMILDRERFFVQCAAMIPINGTPSGRISRGAYWIEVSKENSSPPWSSLSAIVPSSKRSPAASPTTCPPTSALAQEVSICIETGTERRFVHFPPESQHAFAREQRDGIDSARQKEILVEYAKAIEDVELLDHVYKVSENGVDQRADRPTRSSRPGEQRTNNGVAAGVARPRTAINPS